jgi:hypothetical protein
VGLPASAYIERIGQGSGAIHSLVDYINALLKEWPYEKVLLIVHQASPVIIGSKPCRTLVWEFMQSHVNQQS